IVEIVGAAQTAGTGHVLHDDRRLARKMRAKIARNEAAVEVIGAAGLEARNERDGFAFEVGPVLRAGGMRDRQQRDCVERPSPTLHVDSSPRPGWRALRRTPSFGVIGDNGNAFQRGSSGAVQVSRAMRTRSIHPSCSIARTNSSVAVRTSRS